MCSGIRQLVIGTALATALSAVGISVIGNAVAQSTVGRASVAGQDTVIGGYEFSISSAAARLGDRQQLGRYFLDGSRDRLR